MKAVKIKNHDDYIDKTPQDLRPLLVELRTQLASILSDAEEVIAYNMPGFRIGTSIIVGYAAFSKQCGLYVAASAVESCTEEIMVAGLKATKTGVTFSPSKPIPNKLIKKLALASKKNYTI